MGVGSPIAPGLALAAFLLTQTGIALMTLPVWASYWLWIAFVERRRTPARARRSRTPWLGALAIALAIGFGASAFQWLPLLVEGAALQADRSVADIGPIYPHQLLSPVWGFGAEQAGPNDERSFEVGLVPFALTLFAVAAAWWLRQENRPIVHTSRRRSAHLSFFAVAAVLSALLTLPPALPLWQVAAFLIHDRGPAQLLSVTAFALAVAGGASGLLSDGKAAGQVALATFIGAAVLAVFPYLATPAQIFRPIQDADRAALERAAAVPVSGLARGVGVTVASGTLLATAGYGLWRAARRKPSAR
jgi:hypothetical protein